MIKKLIEFRNKLKSKKPTFIRHDAHKKKRVSKVWRRPKGRQNKMRLHKRGYARDRSTGFGSPKAVRGLTREGLVPHHVTMVKDMSGLDSKKDGIIISRSVGNRRRAELVKEAKNKKLPVLNIDTDKFEQSLKERIAKKEKHKKQLAARKKSKVVESEDKSSEKTAESKLSKEDQKKEQDKILTKKGEQQ